MDIPEFSRILVLIVGVFQLLPTGEAGRNNKTKQQKEPTDEQRLYKYLMSNYDHNTRPVYNAAYPVNVSIGITLTQIFDVDERNQVISTNIWFDQEWYDEKLIWDPDDYNGLKVFRIPCASIWRPDIVLYNSADDYNNGYMQALAMVHSNGQVFWPPIVKLRSTCNIDITYFPFDDQRCKLKMGSWAYDGFQVDLYARDNPVDLSTFVSNGEWELIKVEAIRNVITYPCCPEPFPDVTFYIHIRRRTLYYTYNVIIPCVMLSTLTLSGFWMRPDSGEKVTLGLTVLLAFSVFMLLVAENMPATSSFVPLIGIYLTTVMSMTSLSVILAVLTSNINHRGQKEVSVPRWLAVILTGLSKVMCMDLVFVNGRNKRSADDWQTGSGRGVQRPYHYISTAVSGDSGCLIDYENGDTHAQLPNNHSNHMTRQQGNQREDNKDYLLIIQKLDELIAREEERDKADLYIKQWVEVAEIIDRFFFWLFVTGTLIASLFLLIVYPLFKETKEIVPQVT
ncbi:neuronal acetylcholine receptor subunit alpha-10-like isoform X1 [Mercenaria mercenaria]|uniref:neuronal acetylcholine receptor subunit alpha-10-like isoform X1 n=2 Tax=Mercenaria mercenaria TaxID=6596 RepID=UPI001E1E1743|nr:neuronal acetylcholine receptor subunit alpha-10-like isoform X1 [Mercenaria mercenaria]XP_045215712.1 neuronal acetylcholine receptor subunit alpha-10-like isoform X1 [Mercenaria mercenaria]XP_045215713.1 neuronal acetylcholine receptor subunit alpha-10-like isoform X1 [Mercenaria mercenaria]XP_045215714.1 neuronal acetylcholine receptor subunit alpha-10-like isoform X1 [Mercenaria mercenaria]XP_045215715.1 neuronal acetylcholine receptor subunit alpha-10-like isoform X1 [Mercenaria mercena